MTPGDAALILLVNVTWALNFLVGKLGVECFTPMLFSALRFTILGLLLWPWLCWKPGKMFHVLAISLVLGVLHFSMIFIGLDASGDISSVAIAAQLYVPFSALLARYWLGERLGGWRSLGIAVAFSGVVIIGFDPTVFAHLEALAWVVGAAVAMAVATVMMRRLSEVSVLTLQAWVGTIAAPAQFLLSLLMEEGPRSALHMDSWKYLVLPLYSAVGASLLGHGVLYYLLTRYPVSLITPLLLVAPVLAVGLGIAVWGDQPSWKLLIGGFLTLTGVALVAVTKVEARS